MSEQTTPTAPVYEMDADLAAYAAAVAKALASLAPAKPSYGGEFYVSEATISYDGDSTAVSVVANDDGGYSILVNSPAMPVPQPAEEDARV